MKAVEWITELNRRVDLIREEVEKNIRGAQQERKERHDKSAVVRKFVVGEKVLTRLPGLRSKLEGSWEGPFVVLDVPSEVHVVLGIPVKECAKGKGKRVHINSFHQVSAARVAVWAAEDKQLEECTRLEGGELPKEGQKQLDCVLERWKEPVLCDQPGTTDLVIHEIETGDAPPVKSVPYQIPDKWKEPVRQ